jgi:sugar phosphate isomerase/epimerase
MTPPENLRCSRRSFLSRAVLMAGASPSLATLTSLAQTPIKASSPGTPGRFTLRHILASSLYGKLPMDVILSEARRAGFESLDVWPEPHGNQREQIESMGHAAFLDLLAVSGVKLAIYSCYSPGLADSTPWIKTVRKLGGDMIVAHSGGPSNLAGAELKSAIEASVARLRPVFDCANEHGVRIAVENHGSSMVRTPESIRMFLDLMDQIDARHVGLALAPYHLPSDPTLLADLIRDLGDRLFHFYAWEHGTGSSKAQPKVQELKQLPGHGQLDFVPVLAALRDIRYSGWTSLFMHPFPRGIPILPTATEVTAVLLRSKEYLDDCLRQI